MRILLDTCTLIWLELDTSKIPSRLRQVLLEPETQRWFSAAGAWEIGMKWSNGRLPLPCPPQEFLKQALQASLIESLPVFETAVLQLSKLPRLHSDPFDRIQISQAIEHGLAIATPDPLIRQYAVRTVWD